MTIKSKDIGNRGERLVEMFLMKHGYTIISKNYLRPWGEIDIVAKNKGIIHFIEVKAKEINSETDKLSAEYRPEDHMHSWKVKRFRRIIETWIMDKDYEGDWQIDVAIAYVSKDKEIESVDMFWDIVL
ncbi:MAG: YraN family protein [Minisyncoccia bacterium]